MNPPPDDDWPEDLPPDVVNPRGTLVILLIFALALAVGWFALYFLVFLPRGTVGG